ncbi:MAG: metallophosphoesterase [Opitutales bacterium]
MNTAHQLTNDACLLIFDPHQDKEWVERVIEREGGGVSHLLLGGDYFDAFAHQRQVSAGEMAAYLLELERDWGDRLTVLLGNHDIPYIEALPWSREGGTPPRLVNGCPGWTSECSIEIAGHLTWAFWSGTRLFQSVNGHLISHAGLARRYWFGDNATVVKALHDLDHFTELAWKYRFTQHLGILGAGQARGGRQATGGITWQDWDREFRDALPLPQIVGHTPSPRGARQKGRSWCLDGEKTCYGILHRDGSLLVRGL